MNVGKGSRRTQEHEGAPSDQLCGRLQGLHQRLCSRARRRRCAALSRKACGVTTTRCCSTATTPPRPSSCWPPRNVGKIAPLTLLYSDHEAWWPTEALAIQANLEAGRHPGQAQQGRVRRPSGSLLDKGKFDLALGVWSPDYADPYMFMNFWFDSNNFGLAGNRAFYSNPQVDSLIRKAAVATDKSDPRAAVPAGPEDRRQRSPYVYLYQTNFLLPMRSSITGFEFNPMLQGIYNLAQMKKS